MATKDKDKKSRRPYGSVAPALSLDEAIGIAKAIYENAGGEVSYDGVAGILDNSPSSSTFVKKIAALRNYGLVTDENKILKVSEIGKGIVAPKGESERAEAKKKAF